jgi:hypothetical protein
MDLDAAEGMLLVDVVAGKIAHVEVPTRAEVRRNLLASLPRRSLCVNQASPFTVSRLSLTFRSVAT